ncbi:hypothetical protein F2Q68_00020317 [Brassica cretica]|uniref:Uncharacterized protein n=1 Tax=Brassica cretica TaxID=69181 RepID=A0A8S9G352_BRACR|nr:hypothetical protein F2Q68_00020317 [Brassica cretica]
MHTFFTCPFAIGVWKSILFHRVVHIATEDEFEKVLTLFKDKLCLPPTRISRNILMWICWSIWLATNSLIFEAKQAWLAWIFTGTGFTTLLQGSCTQDFVNSSLMAEALVMCLAIINTEQSTKSCRLKKFMESFVISMRSPLRSLISPSFIPLVIETEKPMR